MQGLADAGTYERYELREKYSAEARVQRTNTFRARSVKCRWIRFETQTEMWNQTVLLLPPTTPLIVMSSVITTEPPPQLDSGLPRLTRSDLQRQELRRA